MAIKESDFQRTMRLKAEGKSESEIAKINSELDIPKTKIKSKNIAQPSTNLSISNSDALFANSTITYDNLVFNKNFAFTGEQTINKAYQAFSSKDFTTQTRSLLKNDNAIEKVVKASKSREKKLVDGFNSAGLFTELLNTDTFLKRMTVAAAGIVKNQFDPTLVQDMLIVIYGAKIEAETAMLGDDASKKLKNALNRLHAIASGKAPFNEDQLREKIKTYKKLVLECAEPGFKKDQVLQQYLLILEGDLKKFEDYYMSIISGVKELADIQGIQFNYGYGDFIGYNYGDIGEVFTSLLNFLTLKEVFGDKVTIEGGMAGNSYTGFNVKDLSDKEKTNIQQNLVNHMVVDPLNSTKIAEVSIQKPVRLGVVGSGTRTIDTQYTLKYTLPDVSKTTVAKIIPFDIKLSLSESRSGKYIGEYNTNINNISIDSNRTIAGPLSQDMLDILDAALLLLAGMYLTYGSHISSKLISKITEILTLLTVTTDSFLDHFVDVANLNLEDNTFNDTDNMPYFVSINNKLYWFSKLLEAFENYYFNAVYQSGKYKAFEKIKISDLNINNKGLDSAIFKYLVYSNQNLNSIIGKLIGDAQLNKLYTDAISAVNSISLKLNFAINLDI